MELNPHAGRSPRGRVGRPKVALLALATVLLIAACQSGPSRFSSDSYEDLRVERLEVLPIDGWVRALAFSKAGRALAIGGCQEFGSDTHSQGDESCSRGIVQTWDLAETHPEATVGLPRAVTALAVSPDGNRWIAGDAEGRLILSSPTPKPVGRPVHQMGQISALAFSPDGKWVASGSLDSSFPLGLMDISTGGMIKVKARFDPVTAVAFSPDGKTLAIGMTRGGIVLWNFTSSQPAESAAGSLPGPSVTSAAFSADGEWLAYGREDGRVVIVERGINRVSVEFTAAAAVNSLTFSPDGRWLAIGQENGKVLLIDSKHGTQVWGKHHVLPVSDVAFSPDGTSLAVAAQQNVYVYHVGEGNPSPGFSPKPGPSPGTTMRAPTMSRHREGLASAVSSRRFARVMQIAQDEFMWLLPFDRLTLKAVEAMGRLASDVTVERDGPVPDRLVLTRAGRSQALDLSILGRAEGPKGLRQAVQAFESAERFLSVGGGVPASRLEEAAIGAILAELGPGLHLVSDRNAGPSPVRSASEWQGPLGVPFSVHSIADIQDLADGNGNVRYVKLAALTQPGVRQVQQWITRESWEGFQSVPVVLDLRDNPGGDWGSSIATAAQFIPKGELIATMIARKTGERIEYRAPGFQKPPPTLVVLVNERTAGTAEMLACAIRSAGVGVIVGTPTAGVDDVHTVFRLPLKDGLRVSTGRFLCPDDLSVRWNGLMVDVNVAQGLRADVVPIGASRADSLRRPQFATSAAARLPSAEDQQLRVSVKLASCLGRGRLHSSGNLPVVGQRDHMMGLLSICR